MGCSESPIGSLRSRIIIQSRTRTDDGVGGATTAWSTFSTVWAEIKPTGAREAFWAKHLEHRVSHKVTIRYLSGVTSDMRISFGSRMFQIKGIRNVDEKSRYLILDCEEGASA